MTVPNMKRSARIGGLFLVGFLIAGAGCSARRNETKDIATIDYVTIGAGTFFAVTIDDIGRRADATLMLNHSDPALERIEHLVSIAPKGRFNPTNVRVRITDAWRQIIIDNEGGLIDGKSERTLDGAALGEVAAIIEKLVQLRTGLKLRQP